MPNDNRLLLDDRPLIVIPELAFAIGLNNAIVLQQIHYWVKINERANKNFREGYYWTYNSYDAWRRQFPFWSVSTIKRIFMELEADACIATGNYNRLAIDRTKWYRVNYDVLDECITLTQSAFVELTMDGSNPDIGRLNLTSPLPEIKTEITPENIVNDIWTEALEELKGQFSTSNFRTWLKDIVPLSFDGEVFVVGAKNAFIAEYLVRNQRSLIEKTLTQLVGEAVTFVCQIAPVSRRKAKEAETINDKIRDLLNAAREITGDEKTDQAIAFLDEGKLEEGQMEAWFQELTEFSLKGGKPHDAIHSD